MHSQRYLEYHVFGYTKIDIHDDPLRLPALRNGPQPVIIAFNCRLMFYHNTSKRQYKKSVGYIERDDKQCIVLLLVYRCTIYKQYTQQQVKLNCLFY